LLPPLGTALFTAWLSVESRPSCRALRQSPVDPFNDPLHTACDISLRTNHFLLLRLPFFRCRALTKQSISKARVLESDSGQRLVQLVDESVRASREGVKHFVEPTPGVLAKAKSKRHNIIFGRRGSGKSSLLQKITADLTVDRTPICYGRSRNL
jgi:hypothetical protein